jgi:chorismate dehydratase
MNKIKISAVSYANTYPFIYGLENSPIRKKIILQKDYPSLCAKNLAEDKVDIGLVPITMIPKLNFHEIVSEYCIGANKEVRSVILACNGPLKKIERIYLDYQSGTSVNLVKILAKYYWDIKVQWLPTTEGFENNTKNKQDGAVLIGDRCFAAEKIFPYRYDLAYEWRKFTGLPFVFAAWVANKKIDRDFKKPFDSALKYGINHLDKVINYFANNQLPEEVDLKSYLTTNIDYHLDEKKLKAMELFFQYLGKLSII